MGQSGCGSGARRIQPTHTRNTIVQGAYCQIEARGDDLHEIAAEDGWHRTNDFFLRHL
jgi:hypothetical protein